MPSLANADGPRVRLLRIRPVNQTIRPSMQSDLQVENIRNTGSNATIQSGNSGSTRLPAGRNYYQGRYYGNINNRFYGPQYGYF